MSQTPFEVLTDSELIAVLQRRGYVVKHESEARRPLSWSRTAPMPNGVDFKLEAVEKLREQITPDLISFMVTPAVAPEFEGDLGSPEIHRAVLRIL